MAIPPGFKLAEDPQAAINIPAGFIAAEQEQSIGDIAVGAANLGAFGITEGVKDLATGFAEAVALLSPARLTSTPSEIIERAEQLQESLPSVPLGEDAKVLAKSIADSLGEGFKSLPQSVQDLINSAISGVKGAGEATFQAVGEIPVVGETLAPIAATAVDIAPTAAIEFAAAATGFKAARAIDLDSIESSLQAAGGQLKKAVDNAKKVSNKPLIDPATQAPTKAFDKALQKQGLTFSNVIDDLEDFSSQLKGLSPEQATNRITQLKLETGSKEGALAEIKLLPSGQIIKDDLATEAIKQGFSAGDVQAVKVASPETKKAMQNMVRISRATKTQSTLEARPTDIVGRSLMDRFTFVRGKANEARNELDKIAKRDLGTLGVDTDAIDSNLLQQLDDLNITLPDKGTLSKKDFIGSQISKDRTSQRIIKDVIGLLEEPGPLDALRAHRVKKQLDSLIDFNKKSAAGLTEAGRNFAKSIRSSLNDSIREVSSDYARVNDVLSSSIGVMDDFQRVLGPSIDVFKEGAEKAVGQDLRGLLSNRKSRISLENAVRDIEEQAINLGGSFGDDINDLVQFANTLDDQFGAVARTSLKGQFESVARKAARGREGFQEFVIGKTAEAVEKARGINDENAFRSIEAILRAK